MANEKKPSALAQYGPVGAPILGIVLAIVFIAVAIVTNSLGEGKAALQTTREKVRKQLDSTVIGGDTDPIPLPDQVALAVNPGEKDDWSAKAGATKMLKLPILWQVTMDSAEEDEFDKYDNSPKDGFWTENEFQRTPYWGQKNIRGEFKNWDRDPQDNQISRKEFEEKPEDPDEQFDRLDADNSGELTEGELTLEQIRKYDGYPYDDKITREEFKNRFEAKTSRDLGPVQNVQAKADAANMVILVTWDAPDVEQLPEDICYYIKRRAPETVKKREADWRKQIAEYTGALEKWESKFKQWWAAKSSDDPEKTNKELEPSQPKAEKKYQDETGEMKPIQPPPVSEWENVTPLDAPVTGNEYQDSAFDTEVTYTYAVFMATKSDPNRGLNVGEKNAAGYYAWPEPTLANGHPVIVHNRIVMGWSGAAGDTANITLTKWLPIPDADGKNVWYKVRVSERVNPNDTLGGSYGMRELTDRSVGLLDKSDAEVSAKDLLPADVKVDFTTGFTYITKTSKGFLLNSSTWGDFELPNATRGPVTDPSAPPSTDDALEIRCMAVKNSGSEARFELTRWVKVDDDWYRVVAVVSAKKGDKVGSSGTVGSMGKDVRIFDAAGQAVESPASKLKEATVDLQAGEYAGLDGRSFTVGGAKVDLFGTIYK